MNHRTNLYYKGTHRSSILQDQDKSFHTRVIKPHTYKRTVGGGWDLSEVEDMLRNKQLPKLICFFKSSSVIVNNLFLHNKYYIAYVASKKQKKKKEFKKLGL